MAKVTIFGLAGTGTTTLGKLLAGQLGYQFVSTGNIFRQQAKEHGLSLYEFELLCNTDPVYDLAIDEQTKKLGQENDGFVLESRLGWYFVPDSFKIKITCSDEVRLGRVATRDQLSLSEAKNKTFKREVDAEKRYQEFYGLTELAPDSAFDLIIDSTHLTPEEICERIIFALKIV